MPIPAQNKNALIIFIKYPAKGSVKTRLAKSLGDEFAFYFYKSVVEKIVRDLSKFSGFAIYIFFTGCDSEKEIEKWLGSEFKYFKQSGDNLGEKMFNAFKEVFIVGNEKAVIIGTDIPDLTIDIINESFQSLSKNDIAVVKTKDGGYCLLGMKKLHKQLFENIEWGTSTVFDSTINKCREQNLKMHYLPQLMDIDCETDLLAWMKNGLESELKNKVKRILGTAKIK